ncbi:MAG: glycosyltransferase family 4 protein [Anaerolineae bacterium]|nr:glycosyltransferase family 4 protein [Anaerolineae bacterium]
MRVALNGLFLAAPATGVGQYLRELVRAMRALAPQDEFVFVAPHADPTAPAPVDVYPTRLSRDNLAKLEFEQHTFPRAAKRGFDLAHVPHLGPPLFPTHPSVVTIHDLIPMTLPAYGGSTAVRLYTRLAAAGAKRAQAILTDSHASARDIERLMLIPRERIHVVHLAADTRYQPPNEEELARVRAKYNLPERYVLYLGGFDVRKNVRRVIETWKRSKFGDWRLVIAGRLPDTESDFFPSVKRMATEAGTEQSVKFIGFVAEKDKPVLYGAARVFLYPSHYEGFGLPPLEAMASGTPVIVSNASSLPEVVGDAGILPAPDDTEGWANALGELLTNERRWGELRERGLARAKIFSWERAARETLAVYRSVV